MLTPPASRATGRGGWAVITAIMPTPSIQLQSRINSSTNWAANQIGSTTNTQVRRHQGNLTTIAMSRVLELVDVLVEIDGHCICPHSPDDAPKARGALVPVR